MTSTYDEPQVPRRDALEPMVLTLTEPLTERSVSALTEVVEHADAGRTVIVDITGISDFDSQGMSALLGLQDSLGRDRVLVVGVREAVARLVAVEDLVDPSVDAPTRHPQLRTGLVMVSPDATTTSNDLLAALEAAVDQGTTLVVVEMAATRAPTRDTLRVLVRGAEHAARRGQHLILLHVADAIATPLTQMGLPATTHVLRQR